MDQLNWSTNSPNPPGTRSQPCCRRLGSRSRWSSRAGDVAEVIRDAVNKFDADLVIIGRGALCMKRSVAFRTNVYSIVRDSPAPVLSL